MFVFIAYLSDSAHSECIAESRQALGSKIVALGNGLCILVNISTLYGREFITMLREPLSDSNVPKRR
jgi:hypothetical protein